MYKILHKERLVPNIYFFEVEAPLIAKKAKPGQFVILMVDEKSERIPITIAGWDAKKGSVKIVFMVVGTSTRKLAVLEEGNSIFSLAGPLGKPTDIDNFGTVVCIAGCFSTGPMIPIARALKKRGNRVISIMEGRSKNSLFWEEKLREVSDELIITTGDGSYGVAGWATTPLKEVLERERVDRAISLGCTLMMRECCSVTKPFGVKTIVALSPIMVDGTGMCGCCRVSVGGETKFACVDGPEFDGHEVDWDLLINRQLAYLDEEMRSLDLWDRTNWHKAMEKRGR
jgi:ferredoxin--NADP+ reductase